MTAQALNSIISRAFVFFVCFWGAWALYYWVAVLVLDASYSTLKTFSPVCLLFSIIGFIYFQRIDFNGYQRSSNVKATRNTRELYFPERSVLALLGIVSLIGVISAILIDYLKLSDSVLGYNIVWMLTTPYALWFWYRGREISFQSVAPHQAEDAFTPRFDVLIFLISSIGLTISIYGISFVTPDDAFYGHVISSTLASPEHPVLSGDSLLGTSAPFSLHPTYRLVGYEVLVALISDVLSLDPLFMYWTIMPNFGAIFWLLSSYILLRQLGAPFPGTTMAICILAGLVWVESHAPGLHLAFLNWGKGLLSLMAAPILFTCVFRYLKFKDIQSWLMLLAAVCGVLGWSSSALFVAPVAVVTAAAVYITFSPSYSIKTAVLLCFSILPAFIFIGYSLWLLSLFPVSLENGGAGSILVDGEAYGGINGQLVVLVLAFIILVFSAFLEGSEFSRLFKNLCIAAVLIPLNPYLFEFIANITGMDLLSIRLRFAFPFIIFVGLLASCVMFFLHSANGYSFKAKCAAFLLGGLWYILFYLSTNGAFLLTEHRKAAKEFFSAAVTQGLKVRENIPDSAYVATGAYQDVLPILPDPPTFVSVRHYLQYHRPYLDETVFNQRAQLSWLLKNRQAIDGKSLDQTTEWVAQTSIQLGVNSLVFFIGPNYFDTKRSDENEAFSEKLVDHLRSQNFHCKEIPSANVVVCNSPVIR